MEIIDMDRDPYTFEQMARAVCNYLQQEDEGVIREIARSATLKWCINTASTFELNEFMDNYRSTQK